MSESARRSAFRFVLVTFLLGLLMAGAAFALAARYPDVPHQSKGNTVRVEITRGMTLGEVTSVLRQANAIGRPLLFRLYASWRGVEQRIRAGSYEIRTNMTPRELLALLVRGAAASDVTVTIPEGRNMFEVIDLLVQAKVGKRDELLRLVRSSTFIAQLGIQAPTLEGYLFPETYRLRPKAPEPALRALVGHFRQVFDELTKRHTKAVAELKRSLNFGEREIITMASIVEKETGQPQERPQVASVYLNRLRFSSFQPKLLEADPTIVYGCIALDPPSAACRRFRDRIRTAQLRDRDNPYNTYVHAGLPPGPIANPGRASLESVLAPAKTDFLFFVSRNDGTHHFSSSMEEHRRAVDRYQRGPQTQVTP